MATKKSSSSIVKKESAAASAVALDFAADAGAGIEGADKDSFAIPFIAVLQGLSPQLETVDGARPGKLLNTITNELFDELLVVPCAFQRRFIRWAPRESGGGYKGDYSPIDIETGKIPTTPNEKGQPTIEGDILRDTRNHFVLARSASGEWKPALISLSSTQIKKSKRWMSLIQGIELRDAQGRAFTPPSFSHIYSIKTVKEENTQGAWWGVEIGLHGAVQDAELYAKAKAFHASVSAGEVAATPPQPDFEGAAGDKF